MTPRNPLIESPPYRVDKALKRLGANLRIARLRRNLTIQEVAQKIGTGPRAVADAEKGKPSTGIAVYMALLWAYDLLGAVAEVADPSKDDEGMSLSLRQGRTRARRSSGGMDNDF
jgi:transcriptional regulator with XRE-family HTH domain